MPVAQANTHALKSSNPPPFPRQVVGTSTAVDDQHEWPTMSFGEEFPLPDEGGSGSANPEPNGADDQPSAEGSKKKTKGGAKRKAAELGEAPAGKRGKNRVCQIIDCETVYSSAHECRARACAKHCAELSVQLKGRDAGEQSRFCYQCHKFHDLDAFRTPDGTLRARHNCYESQVLRLDRRKKKDAAKASNKNLAAQIEAASRTGLIVNALNLARANNDAASQLLFANAIGNHAANAIGNAQVEKASGRGVGFPGSLLPGSPLTAALEQELVGASADGSAGRGGGSPLDIDAPGHKARGGRFGAGFGAAHFDAAFEATGHRYDGLFRGRGRAKSDEGAAGGSHPYDDITGVSHEETMHDPRGQGGGDLDFSPDLLGNLLSGWTATSK